MANLIGNPDPPLSSIGKPVGAPVDIGLPADTTVRVGKLVPTSTTALQVRNNADSADNLNITDAGILTLRNNEVFSVGNGAAKTVGFTTELITLSTSTTVTTSAGNLIPANSLIDAVLVEPTVTITASTSFKVGDPTSDARFLSFTTSIGAGQASFGVNQWNPALGTTLALSAIQSAATTVKVTVAASVATAGKIRVTVFYRGFAGPTS